MPIELDHLIVDVNDLDETSAFYTSILGFTDEGDDGPFRVLRVTPTLVVLLGPWGTEGNNHYAFALSSDEFAEVVNRLEEAGIPYGDSFHDTTNMAEPAMERGALGMGPSLYFLDPNRHLLEIRHYGT